MEEKFIEWLERNRNKSINDIVEEVGEENRAAVEKRVEMGEKIFQTFTEEELKEKVGQFVDVIVASAKADFKEIIGERSRGIILWKWCLIIALIFLLAEVLLLRFWKA